MSASVSYGRFEVRRLVLQFATAGALAFGMVSGAFAEGFPSKPVKIVVTFAAGGASDLLARVVGQKMGEELGQPVIVENRLGAGGVIGAQAVAQAAPDGYTVLLAGNSFVINSVMRERAPYDAIKDFTPVAMLANSPFLLTVNPQLKVKSFPEFVALARREPGKVRFAAAGPGTAPHIAFEVMKSSLKLDMLYVPYPGETPGLMATASGVVDATYMNYSGLSALLGSGKVDVITVMWPTRLDRLKDVPTVSESGFKGLESGSWQAMLAPKSTPPAVVAKLNAAANKALKSPEVLEKLSALGMFPAGGSSQQLESHLAAQAESYRDISRSLSIKVE